MLRIDDLKRRRNEWVPDQPDFGDRYGMMDATGFIHTVSSVYFGGARLWVIAWIQDEPSLSPSITPMAFASAAEATAWADRHVASHFAWFEAA